MSVIEVSNADAWIEKAATKNQRDLEREVASRLPAPAPKERIRPVGGEMSELKLVIPEALRKQIERIQEVRGCSILEAVAFACEETLKRHDPVRKAERNAGKPKKVLSSRKAGRSPTPAPEKHEVTNRDQGQCTWRYVDGTPCESRRWVHLHHRVHVSRAGTNAAGNLTTLCSAHHRIQHSPAFSPSFFGIARVR